MLTKRKKLKMIYEYCERYYDRKIHDKNFKGLGRIGLMYICEIINKKKFDKHLEYLKNDDTNGLLDKI